MKDNHSIAIIFDVDKTLVLRNLHEILIESWVSLGAKNALIFVVFNSIKTILFFGFLKRRIEYFLLIFINQHFINQKIVDIFESPDNLNKKLIKRLSDYKKYRYPVFLVSALPSKVATPFAEYLGVKAYHSSTFLGFLYKDLLGKKIQVYKKIESYDFHIGTVYSDSYLDFYEKSKKNILVQDANLVVIRK